MDGEASVAGRGAGILEMKRRRLTSTQMAYSLALVISIRDTESGYSFDALKEIINLTFIVALLWAVSYQLNQVVFQFWQDLLAVLDLIDAGLVVLNIWAKIAIWAVT